jgi:hypothetical protein
METKLWMKTNLYARRAYALSSVVVLIFLLSVLLGVGMTHLGYSIDVMNVHVTRIEARSDLASMTNLALRWLRAELATGTRPRAEAIEFSDGLTDFNLLSIFSLDKTDEMKGSVRVFDLEYNPENVMEPVADPLFFPPCFPGGYLIRANVAKRGSAPIMAESVYVVIISDDPEKGMVYTLRERPLYWRELFR